MPFCPSGQPARPVPRNSGTSSFGHQRVVHRLAPVAKKGSRDPLSSSGSRLTVRGTPGVGRRTQRRRQGVAGAARTRFGGQLGPRLSPWFHPDLEHAVGRALRPSFMTTTGDGRRRTVSLGWLRGPIPPSFTRSAQGGNGGAWGLHPIGCRRESCASPTSRWNRTVEPHCGTALWNRKVEPHRRAQPRRLIRIADRGGRATVMRGATPSLARPPARRIGPRGRPQGPS